MSKNVNKSEDVKNTNGSLIKTESPLWMDYNNINKITSIAYVASTTTLVVMMIMTILGILVDEIVFPLLINTEHHYDIGGKIHISYVYCFCIFIQLWLTYITFTIRRLAYKVMRNVGYRASSVIFYLATTSIIIILNLFMFIMTFSFYNHS